MNQNTKKIAQVLSWHISFRLFHNADFWNTNKMMRWSAAISARPLDPLFIISVIVDDLRIWFGKNLAYKTIHSSFFQLHVAKFKSEIGWFTLAALKHFSVQVWH